jgi:hypothetical protein
MRKWKRNQELTLITKTKVTANELRDIFAERLGVPRTFVVIYPLPVLGWGVTLIAGRTRLSDAAARAEQLARELRPQYEVIVG